MSDNSSDMDGCLVLLGCIIFPPLIIIVLVNMYNKSNSIKIDQTSLIKEQNELLQKQIDPTFKTTKEKLQETQLRQITSLNETELKKYKYIKTKIFTEYNDVLITSFDTYWMQPHHYLSVMCNQCNNQYMIHAAGLHKNCSKCNSIKFEEYKREFISNLTFENIFLTVSFIGMLITVFYFGFYT